jgi:O-antigen ligase
VNDGVSRGIAQPVFVRHARGPSTGQYQDPSRNSEWVRDVEGVGTQHRLNALLAIGLVTVLVLAPVPLGSNRPAFWTIWGCVIGLLGLLYIAGLVTVRAKLRVGIGKLWAEAVLFAGLLGYLFVQIAPVGRFFDLGIETQAGTRVSPLTISLDPGSTRLALLQFLSFGVLFFLMLQAGANRRRARRILLTVFVAIAGFAAFGLASLTLLDDTILGLPKEAYLGFATGTFVNRNSYATFLAVGVVVGLPMLIEVLRDTRGRTLAARLGLSALLVVGLAIIGATLFATGSRMGSLSAAVGLFVALAAILSSRRGGWRLAAFSVATLLVAAVGLLSVTGTTLLERLVFTDGLDQGRAELHAQTWNAILLRPLLGYGGDAFASVFPIFQQASSQGAVLWDHSHSTYLALWFELGMIAGSVPLIIVTLIGLRCVGAISDDSDRVISAAAIGTIVVFAAHSLLDFSAEIEANAFLFVAILALGAGGMRGHQAATSRRGQE